MKKDRLAATCLVLVASGTLVAGCGSTAANDFRGQVNGTLAKYQPQLKTIEARIPVDRSNPHALSADFTQIANVAFKFADDVAALNTPDNAKLPAGAFVGAERSCGKAAQQIAAAATANDTTGIRAGVAAFQACASVESSALKALNAIT